MRSKDTLNAKDLEEERQQLLTCRRAFFLLGMAFVLEIAAIFLLPFYVKTTPDRDIVRSHPQIVYALAMGQLICLMIPASVLLIRCGRSPRWKSSAKLLLSALVVHVVLLLALVMTAETGVVLTEPEPLGIRILHHCSTVLGWIEWWFIAILIAEFSLASRSEMLVESTEMLGYAILAGIFASLSLAAWSLPMPTKPGNMPDTVSILLQVISTLLLCVVLFWEFRLTAITAALARVLARHCDDLKQAKLRNTSS